MRFLPFIFALIAMPATAHELWIEPLNYTVAADSRLQAQLVNGQHFGGPGTAGEAFGTSRLAYLPKWFQRFDVTLGDTTEAVTGRIGDSPALNMEPVGEGLNVVVYQSAGDRLTYDGWEKFVGFAEHKDFPQVVEQHLARGFTKEKVREDYTRYSKSLIGVGAAQGSDRNFGLETEIVALQNPYTDALGGKLRVQLFYQGEPRRDVQVELFDKDAEGVVSVSLQRTDAEGVAVLPVVPGHSYMADAVVMREAAEGSDAMWESLWANLTFAVPE